MGSKRPKLDISISVMDEIECPVCFQVPRGNVYECADGHHLCDICSKKVTKCPTCRSVGVGDRNRALERVLDKMKFPCSWREQGCEETMYRGQLSAHEDQCDHNPDTIQFCSKFPHGQKFGFKCTPKWLTDSDNCMEFIDHVHTHLGYPHNEILRYGQRSHVNFGLNGILLKKPSQRKPVHHFFKTVFHQVCHRNRVENELIFFLPLLKVDSSGNQILSFAVVQLTPMEEKPPTFVKFAIDAIPNSKMVSKWGQNSLSSLNWTQKVICFNEFVEMVEKETSLPYSLPVSLLAEYYTNSDKRLTVKFSLEETC